MPHQRRYVILSILFSIALSALISTAHAASFTAFSISFDRLGTSQSTDIAIDITTAAGVNAGETVTLTFAPSFDLSAITLADIDFRENTVDKSLALAPAAAVWGVSIGAQTITFTSGTDTIAPTSTINILIGSNAAGGSNKILNPGTAGVYSISSGGTQADSGDGAITITSDDQVHISAKVTSTTTTTTTGGGGGGGGVIFIPTTTTSPTDNETQITVDEPAGICDGFADLNCDTAVDLIDFSILIFWFNKTDMPDHVDLNKDGSVDIFDFSIMAFYWTAL